MSTQAPARVPRKLAVNRLRGRRDLDEAVVDRFVSHVATPLVEGGRCTFLWRGEADEVWLVHRIVGMPPRVPLRRIGSTSLWYAVIELPDGSRVEYQIQIRRGDDYDTFNDPMNPHVAHSPVGSSSECFGPGYAVPEWTQYDPEAREGTLLEQSVTSRALRREVQQWVYLPARFRTTTRYPLLVVHDGSDFLNFAAAKTVLDNLIHRLDLAETVVVFTDPGNRLAEYANSAAHTRYLTEELVPDLEQELPLLGRPSGRAVMGSSFGAIASLSAAVRKPGFFGSMLVMSGSFVFTDIGVDHGGGPAFDPVVKFMNRYRARPRRVVDRMFISCGVYEPLIVPNRSMVPVFEATGMTVRYVEARDGHNWSDWRDRLHDGLSWIYPGPHKFVYE